MSLKDKVALVTGAGRGLGLALARQFAAAGARIVVNDINPDSAERAAQAIIAAGGQVLQIHADVANKLAVQTMHYEILEQWRRVDILVNHAAIRPAGSLLTLDEWAWNRVMDVNLKGAFLCSQTVGRGMKEQGGGIILTVLGAVAGQAPQAAFAASQAGLLSFTRECAAEFASYNIRVHAVRLAPDSPPEAAAAAVLNLCASEARADLILDC